MNFNIILVVVLLTVSCGSALPAQAAVPQECRTASLPDGTPALFCKDKKGNWKQQEGEVAIAPKSANADQAVPLSVEATYQGTYSMAPNFTPKFNGNIDFTNILKQATAKPRWRNEGGMTIKAVISGTSVSAVISGTGGVVTTQMNGTYRNGICSIIGGGATGSVTYEGRCDRSGFSGTIKGGFTNGERYNGKFNTSAITYVDTSARDAERAALQKKCDAGSNTACVALDQK